MRSRPECKSSCTPEQREKSPSAQRSSGKKIAYRLLTLVMSQADRLISLTALGMVMLYNELWNIVLFRWQNPYAAFLGVLAYLFPLLLLPGSI